MSTNQITVNTYTAWEGYKWFGLDDDLAKKLEQAKNTISPLLDEFQSPEAFGGLTHIIHEGEKYIVAMRCHCRKHGDKHFRDSLYISAALIPQSNLTLRPIDFEKLFFSPEMELIQEKEPQHLVIDDGKLLRLIPVNTQNTFPPFILDEETPSPFLPITNLYQTPNLFLADITASLTKTGNNYHLKISASLPQELTDYISSKRILPSDPKAIADFLECTKAIKTSLGKNPYPFFSQFCQREASEIEATVQQLKIALSDLKSDNDAATLPSPATRQPIQQKVDYGEAEQLRYEIQKLRNENTHLKRLLQDNQTIAMAPSSPPKKSKIPILLFLFVALAILFITIVRFIPI